MKKITTPLERASILFSSNSFQTHLQDKNYRKLIQTIAVAIQESNIEVIDLLISGLERDIKDGKKIDDMALFQMKHQMRIVKTLEHLI